MSRLKVVFAAVAISQFIIFDGHATAVREVSHEDIRDAIMSLVHLFRDNTDKLERHESRERQLGEQLKKAFTTAEKKQKAEESNTNTIIDLLSSINRRLEAVESIVLKGPKPNDTKQSNFEETVKSKLSSIEQNTQNNQINYLIANIESIQSSITSLDQRLTGVSGSAAETNKIHSKLSEIEPQLAQHQDAIAKVLDSQHSLSKQIANLTEVSGNVKMPSTPSSAGLEQFVNFTASNFEELRQNLIINNRDALILQAEIGKLQQNFSEELKTVKDSVSVSQAQIENIEKISNRYLKDTRDLSKIEQVLIQTADNVLDTKRRIEYGTHQVLLEVGDLVKQQAKDLGAVVNKRYDDISLAILNSQNGALTNLSSKIETEISQVWRQIGIMYQTLTNSADALDKLQQQTEIYVNGSLGTMDNMEGKVGLITSRMTEVDENLNYLLGRLSLVTQEFNQIKTGLGEALDNIRSSFHTVQDKVKETGPGPNPIEEEISTFDGHLAKTKYSVS